jgi:predicted RNase H-like HicB family nuclease
MKIRVVLEPTEDAGYTADVPFLPGCISKEKVFKTPR